MHITCSSTLYVIRDVCQQSYWVVQRVLFPSFQCVQLSQDSWGLFWNMTVMKPKWNWCCACAHASSYHLTLARMLSKNTRKVNPNVIVTGLWSLCIAQSTDNAQCTQGMCSVKLYCFVFLLQVDWEREENCFESFSQECSHFYAITHDPFLSDSERIVAGDSASNTCPSCTASEQSSISQVNHVYSVHSVCTGLRKN